MNFFGHAVVATWHSPVDGFVLGSMLPDFASMCRGRIAAVRDPDVARGVELHHRTDAVFHRLPGFVDLCGRAAVALRDRGVARGGARAAAHVAVELLLDGALARRETAAGDRYLAALDRAADPELPVVWEEPAHGMRWDYLVERLRSAGVPLDYRDPEVVTERVAGVLARRPRLALSSPERAALGAEMADLRREVDAVAESLIAALRRAELVTS